MENPDFKISYMAVWALIIGQTLLTVFGAFAKIQHWDHSQFFLTVGLVMSLFSWIIILSDMLANRIYNRLFWIISMFIIPWITMIVYMIMRNSLIRLEEFKMKHA
ncbi:MAG: GldL-related protein [Bacteroidota bacterium]